jgi:glycerol kinase
MFGITMNTKRGHIARATLEAVSVRNRLVTRSLTPGLGLLPDQGHLGSHGKRQR